MSFLPITGFLGTGATFAADFNLVVQLMMGAALVTGLFHAKHKRYRAHGICQTSVLLLNLLMIALVMWPSLRQQVMPAGWRVFHKRYYMAAAIHGFLGIVAELLGLYIVLVAGTRLVPKRLRFTRWKLWMRAELTLWFVVIISGAGTYYSWYIAPFR